MDKVLEHLSTKFELSDYFMWVLCVIIFVIGYLCLLSFLDYVDYKDPNNQLLFWIWLYAMMMPLVNYWVFKKMGLSR